MASGDYRWLWGRWGKELFPGGLANEREIEAVLDSPYDRRLDESKYWHLDDILGVLRHSFEFARMVLSNETAGSMRNKEIGPFDDNDMWSEIRLANYSGVRLDSEDPAKIHITLEATFRHRYWEHITHLYNIQRLKRAQGLNTVVEIPIEGYLALPTWDLSQP